MDDTTEDSACASDYHQTIIGTYRGTVEFDESGASAAGGSVCLYDLEIEVRHRDIGTGMCDLEAQVSSTVEQSVVLPPENPVASECRGADDTLVLVDPLAATDDPVLGVDYTLPIRLEYQNRAPTPPDRGPYFGDESVSARYVRLFDGLVPEVRVLSFGVDELTFESRGPEPVRVVRGSLTRMR